MELSDYAKQIKSQLTPTEWKIAIAIAEGMEILLSEKDKKNGAFKDLNR